MKILFLKILIMQYRLYLMRGFFYNSKDKGTFFLKRKYFYFCEMMKVENCHWKRSKSVELFGKLWIPDGEMAALVIMVHGVGQHSECYDELAGKFVGQSVGFLAFDLRGHGRSTGTRGHASFNDIRDDLRTIIEDMRRKFANIPIVLLGYSMGGSIVLRYAIDKNVMVQGVIALSPWLQLVHPPSPFLIWLAKWASRIVPWLTVRTGIKADQLSQGNNPGRKTTKTDPLLHKKISIKLFTDLWTCGNIMLRNKYRFEIPVLMMHGTADTLVSFKASKLFAKRNRKFIYFKKWTKMRHDLLNEAGNEMIFRYMMYWLSKQVIKNGTFQNNSQL